MATVLTTRPLAALALPERGAARLAAQLALAVLGTLLLTLSAKTKVVLGPVDMSLQTLAVLLIAISITAMSNVLLRMAVIVAFLLPMISLGLIALDSRNVFDVGLLGLCATAVLFFHYISNRFYRSNLTLMSYQSEKDDLIAELEVAKSVSDEARRRAEEGGPELRITRHGVADGLGTVLQRLGQAPGAARRQQVTFGATEVLVEPFSELDERE